METKPCTIAHSTNESPEKNKAKDICAAPFSFDACLFHREALHVIGILILGTSLVTTFGEVVIITIVVVVVNLHFKDLLIDLFENRESI